MSHDKRPNDEPPVPCRRGFYPLLAAALLTTFPSFAEAASQSASAAPASTAALRETAQDQRVRVVTRVEPAHGSLADDYTMTVTIEAEEGISVEFPPFADEVGDFRSLGQHTALPRLEGNRHIQQLTLELEPLTAGKLEIPPVYVSYVDLRPQGDGKRHGLETPLLTVDVATQVGDNPSLSELTPVEFTRPEPRPWGTWFAAGLTSLFAVAGGVWLLRRRRPAVQLPPREIALAELRHLLDGDLMRHDVKAFYVELTGIVRRYLERTTDVRAPERTTEEFLREIVDHRSFSSGDTQRLGEFLQAADLVKFAGYRPDEHANRASIGRAHDFIANWQRQAATDSRKEQIP